MDPDDGRRRIGSHPFDAFSAPDQVRRLRGRLAAPVTVWTAHDEGGSPTGITVSSIMIAEGDPPSVIGLVGPLSDFWEAAGRSKRFVVHVLSAGQARLADRFAQRYPGDPFEGVDISGSGHGPVIDEVDTRVACSLSGFLDVGFQILVRGRPEDPLLPEEVLPPLVHYRGRYLTVASRR